MTEPECTALLDGAAACLLAVAYGDPLSTPPTVRVPCLWAVELLASVGAVPTRWIPSDDAPASEWIRDALAILAQLPSESFAQDAVLDAASAACAALDATS